MNFLFSKKLKFISLLPNRMEHSEQPKKLCFQLSVAFGLDVLSIQPNFITGSIASRLNAFIVRLLLKLLSMVEVLSANNHQLS